MTRCLLNTCCPLHALDEAAVQQNKNDVLLCMHLAADGSYTCEVITDGAQATLVLPCLYFVGLMLCSNYPHSCCIIYVLIVLCVHKCVMLHKQYTIVLFYT